MRQPGSSLWPTVVSPRDRRRPHRGTPGPQFTELFSIRHPIALAPMGSFAGGALAAAVSEGGGLGLVGAGRESPDWLERELAIVTTRSGKPWGVGFLAWAADPAVVEQALAYQPTAVMLSFGDPQPFVGPICSAGAALIIRVTDLDEAAPSHRRRRGHHRGAGHRSRRPQRTGRLVHGDLRARRG